MCPFVNGQIAYCVSTVNWCLVHGLTMDGSFCEIVEDLRVSSLQTDSGYLQQK